MKQLEMRVTLERLNQHVHFAASNEQGNRIEIDGPARVGGEEGGFRPMQLILAGLASCASMDIVHILHKQRAELRDLRIIATGIREADRIPAPFHSIHLHFELYGPIPENKAMRAVELAVTKYCSVGEMLRHSVTIDWDYSIAP